MIKKLFSHASVKNSFWIISERIIQMLISFILTMITARYLGPSNYGVLNYGLSFVTFFAAVTKLGLDSILVNELINNNKDGIILGTSLLLRLVSSLLSIVIIFLCVFILNFDNRLIIITTMLQSISLIFQAINIFDFWFQKDLKSKYVSISKIIAYFIASTYKVFLLINKFSVELFALSNVIDYFIICILLKFFYTKQGGEKLTFNIIEGKRLLKNSYHFIISSIMVLVYTQIDKIMIGNMIDEANVGIYSAALTIYYGLGFIPDAIITSARPTIYNAKKESKSKYMIRIKQFFCLLFYICISLTILVSLFSRFGISILFGEAYSEAVIPLVLLMISLPFSQIGNGRSIWIVSENLNKYTKRYLGIGAVINVVLNYFLIQRYGIIGAAMATLITEIFVGMISPLLFKETRMFPKLVVDGIFFKFNKS